MVSRQSACYILQRLNEQYMHDPEIVNILHSHTIITLGLKNKIYDGEFLQIFVSLISAHGIAISCGECVGKTV